MSSSGMNSGGVKVSQYDACGTWTKDLRSKWITVFIYTKQKLDTYDGPAYLFDKRHNVTVSVEDGQTQFDGIKSNLKYDAQYDLLPDGSNGRVIVYEFC